MKYTTVTDPIYTDATRTMIDMTVTFEGLGTMPYTAADREGEPEHCRELFRRAVAGDFGTVAEPRALPLESARSRQLMQLAVDYNRAMASLTADYPEQETLSWTKQAIEGVMYRSWQNAGSSGVAPSTPLLTSIFQARSKGGIDESFQTLVQKVNEKNDAYSVAVGTLTGRRHAAEYRIAAATTAADVEAVRWSFAL